ncbi:Zn-dependent hydrolases, including glyoxylases [Pelotomaculum thermopropionicum SI]|uniref:Zn-dependent hydrolases, including glyoxylases n=1 Tax=Pelotomaculum thermopropionicum (strain DSM 13744 / JCM 10971 / SI) TaxID=370438 RepID=A5D4L4_PELTS|nr:Zn-dependent hydrolases, including glyoxylases [Pelotomaculum thermopropionicum SI]
MSAKVCDLGNGIYMVDVFDQEPERTSCYIVAAEKPAVIETGATPGIGHLKASLRELGIPPEKVEYIIVTHIHLDHSGGAGALARDLPNARVFAHPRGAKHLIDPSRLAAGARSIYGERFDTLFGEIVPVPAERVHTPEDGETLDLGGGRVLTFYHTPGHARHHFVVYDPASRGIFGGDAAGIRFYALSRLAGYDFTLPSTPPSEFDPQATIETLDRLKDLDLENIYFTHYGKAAGASAILERNRKLTGVFEATGRQVLESGGGVKEIEEALWDLVMKELEQNGVAAGREHPAVKFLALDMELNAAGIAQYLERKK